MNVRKSMSEGSASPSVVKFENPFYLNVVTVEAFCSEVQQPGPVYLLISRMKKFDKQLPVATVSLNLDVMGFNDRNMVVFFRFSHKMARYSGGQFTRQGDEEMAEAFPIIADGLALRLAEFGYEVQPGATIMMPDNLTPVPGDLDFVKIIPLGEGRGFSVELLPIDIEEEA